MSNVKRKDNKGRNLRLGESQRKDGRYVYKYTDIYGKPQFKYAWKLVPTDKTPAGKREDLSLREKEKQIKKDLADGINTIGGKMTVCQLYAKKNSQRKNVKHNTEKGRQYLMKILENNPDPSFAREQFALLDGEWEISFGGTAFSKAAVAKQGEGAWGYTVETDEEKIVANYERFAAYLLNRDKLSGFCYTQLYDVEQEQNGFYDYHRNDKLSPAQKAAIKAVNDSYRG